MTWIKNGKIWLGPPLTPHLGGPHTYRWAFDTPIIRGWGIMVELPNLLWPPFQSAETFSVPVYTGHLCPHPNPFVCHVNCCPLFQPYVNHFSYFLMYSHVLSVPGRHLNILCTGHLAATPVGMTAWIYHTYLRCASIGDSTLFGSSSQLPRREQGESGCTGKNPGAQWCHPSQMITM